MSVTKLLLGAASSIAVAALTLGVYVGRDDVVVDFEHGYEASFVERFHPRERVGETYFRWTRGVSQVILRHFPEGGRVDVRARIKTIRPAGAEMPELAFTANGVTVHRARAVPGEHEYAFAFPGVAGTLTLGIESDTFEAGGGRRLGVQVLSVGASNPSGRAAWLAPAGWLGLSALCIYLGALAAGAGAVAAGSVAMGLGAALAALLGHGPVPYSDYPALLAWLAAGGLAGVLALKRLAKLLGWPRGEGLRGMLAVFGVSLLVKGAALSFPLWLSSDAEFQANRFDQFLAGEWHPTSVTQHEPPFRIPYPVSLYAAAAPLRMLGLERVSALEAVTVAADVLAGVAVFLLGLRFLGRRAALIAVLVYHASPVNPLALSAGNFTNVFALGVVTLGFALLVATDTGGRTLSWVGAASCAFLALTAHFGMLLEGSLLWVAWLAGLYLLIPRPLGRDRRLALVASVALAFAAAGVYYLGYLELVTSQWQRALGGGSGAGPSTASKLALSFGMMREQLGLVTILAALAGAAFGLRGRLTETAFHYGLAVWLGATAVFLAVDLLSPLQIRYWYQSLPAVALLAGGYLSAAFQRGWLGRIAGGAAVLYIAANGALVLYESMVSRYH